MQQFQYSPLADGFNCSSSDMYRLLRHETMITKRLQFRDQCKVGIQNGELRSLCISAYLRCLLASIESAPDTNIFENAIKNIKADEMFT